MCITIIFYTDQIIRKPIPIHVFDLYATDITFNMSINFLSYLCSLRYFIYISIMLDYFSVENICVLSMYYFISRSKIMSDYFLAAKPIDIEGEAE